MSDFVLARHDELDSETVLPRTALPYMSGWHEVARAPESTQPVVEAAFVLCRHDELDTEIVLPRTALAVLAGWHELPAPDPTDDDPSDDDGPAAPSPARMPSRKAIRAAATTTSTTQDGEPSAPTDLGRTPVTSSSSTQEH